MTNQPIDKQSFERLRNEIIDLLLATNSPARNLPELKPLIEEHQGLVQRQTELKALEAKIAEVLPVVEQAEAQVTAAEKQVLAEKKHLASFAGELGRAVFAGFQAGELPDQPVLEPRKQLHAKIDALRQQRSTLLAEEKTTFIDKTKQQAQQLALAGQIKVEELKIGSADRALGETILASNINLNLNCTQTTSVLKSIADQQRQILVAQDQQKNAAELSDQRRSDCAARLERVSVASSDLKVELKETRKRISQNESRLTAIRESTITAALSCDELNQSERLGESLQQLRASLADKTVARQPLVVGAKAYSNVKSQVAKSIRWSAIGSFATIVWVLFMSTLLVWRVGSLFIPGKRPVSTSSKPNSNALEKQDPSGPSKLYPLKQDSPSVVSNSSKAASRAEPSRTTNNGGSTTTANTSAKPVDKEAEKLLMQLLIQGAISQQQQQQKLRNQQEISNHQWQQQEMMRQQQALKSPAPGSDTLSQSSNIQKSAPVDPGKPCPACGGSGLNRQSPIPEPFPRTCDFCNGAGRLSSERAALVPTPNRLPGYGR